MTLIISVQCTDGFVIISDRKEGQGPSSNNVSKCLLSQNNDFFIALAGNGGLPRGILSILNSSEITSSSVVTEIEEYVKTFNDRVEPNSRSTEIKGFLVIKDGGIFKLKILEVSGQMVFVLDDSSPVSYVGFSTARIFAKHFLDKFPLNEMKCKEATKYVVAVIDELSKSIPEVGGFDFGYDIIKFSSTNDISQITRFTDSDIGDLRIHIDIDNSKIIFPEGSTEGDQTNA